MWTAWCEFLLCCVWTLYSSFISAQKAAFSTAPFCSSLTSLETPGYSCPFRTSNWSDSEGCSTRTQSTVLLRAALTTFGSALLVTEFSGARPVHQQKAERKVKWVFWKLQKLKTVHRNQQTWRTKKELWGVQAGVCKHVLLLCQWTNSFL